MEEKGAAKEGNITENGGEGGSPPGIREIEEAREERRGGVVTFLIRSKVSACGGSRSFPPSISRLCAAPRARPLPRGSLFVTGRSEARRSGARRAAAGNIRAFKRRY